MGSSALCALVRPIAASAESPDGRIESNQCKPGLLSLFNRRISSRPLNFPCDSCIFFDRASTLMAFGTLFRRSLLSVLGPD